MTTINIDATSFPLFGIKAINSNLFVTGGGGGAARTGVNNSIVSLAENYNINVVQVFVGCKDLIAHDFEHMKFPKRPTYSHN